MLLNGFLFSGQVWGQGEKMVGGHDDPLKMMGG